VSCNRLGLRGELPENLSRLDFCPPTVSLNLVHEVAKILGTSFAIFLRKFFRSLNFRASLTNSIAHLVIAFAEI
jgi:hypothetical protein